MFCFGVLVFSLRGDAGVLGWDAWLAFLVRAVSERGWLCAGVLVVAWVMAGCWVGQCDEF